jgi:hypothetical protein
MMQSSSVLCRVGFIKKELYKPGEVKMAINKTYLFDILCPKVVDNNLFINSVTV